MNIKTKTLKFNKTEITFMEYTGRWMVPAKFIGQAMGYANEGQSLCDLISNTWARTMDKWSVHIFEGKDLVDLKEETLKYGVSFRQANAVMFLTMEGVISVLFRSRTSMAKEFRNFLAKNGGELLAGQRSIALATTKKVTKKVSAPVAYKNLDDIFKTLDKMRKLGLVTKGETKSLLTRVLESQLVKHEKDLGVTHYVEGPNSALAAIVGTNTTTLATPSGNYRLMSYGERHPDFADWVPAEDIARMCGLTKDTIKKYIKEYCEDEESLLPNVEARTWISHNGGNFMSPDRHGFLTFMSQGVDGIAVYYKMDANQLVWRNYWSPTAVQAILTLVSSAKLAAELKEEAKRVKKGLPPDNQIDLLPISGKNFKSTDTSPPTAG